MAESKSCAECAAVFVVRNTRQRFCAERCAERARERRRGGHHGQANCGICGRRFSRHNPTQAHCSHSCSRFARFVEGTNSTVSYHSCRMCEVVTTGERSCPTSRSCRRRAQRVDLLLRSVACVDCGATFSHRRSGRPVLRCISCRVAAKRKHKRSRPARARRRARLRTATIERFTHTEIFDRDGWLCGICGQPTERDAVVPALLAPTLDHVVPLAAGGAHSRANVQCAHFICNSRKGANVVSEGEQLRLVG